MRAFEVFIASDREFKGWKVKKMLNNKEQELSEKWSNLKIRIFNSSIPSVYAIFEGTKWLTNPNFLDENFGGMSVQDITQCEEDLKIVEANATLDAL